MDIDDVPLENIFDLPTPPRPARPSNANPLFLQSPSVAGGSPPPPAARNNSYQQRPGGGDGARRNLASAMSLFDDLDEEDDAVIPGRENPGEGLAGGAGAAAGEAAKEGEEAGKEKGKRTIAKIDAPRLLGPNGLPRLVEASKKIKFKGKGHEAEDLKNLLGQYQIWSHQLFPKTKFKDSVVKVEKVCRERRMLSALGEYKNSYHPKPKSPSPPPPSPLANGNGSRSPSRAPPNDISHSENSNPFLDGPSSSRRPTASSSRLPSSPQANATASSSSSNRRPRASPPLFAQDDDEFDDDLIAQAEMEEQEAASAAAAAAGGSGGTARGNMKGKGREVPKRPIPSSLGLSEKTTSRQQVGGQAEEEDFDYDAMIAAAEAEEAEAAREAAGGDTGRDGVSGAHGAGADESGKTVDFSALAGGEEDYGFGEEDWDGLMMDGIEEGDGGDSGGGAKLSIEPGKAVDGGTAEKGKGPTVGEGVKGVDGVVQEKEGSAEDGGGNGKETNGASEDGKGQEVVKESEPKAAETGEDEDWAMADELFAEGFEEG